MKGPKCSTQIKRCIRRELQPSALTISKSDVLVRSTGTGALSGSTSIIGTTDIDASSITVDDLNATTAQISKMQGFTLTSGITFNNISNTGPFKLDNWSMYSSGDNNVLTVTDNTGNAKLNAAGTAGILYLEGAATEIKSRISDITLLSSEGSIVHNTKRGSKILTTNNVTGTALNLFDPDIETEIL